jgi:adenosylcobinamide-phosphate synthase
MGLLALIFSVVVDAIWPLRGRPQDLPFDEAGRGASLDDDAADPLAEAPPYDPVIDPLVDPLAASSGQAGQARAAGSAPPHPPKAAATPLQHPLQRYALRLIDAVAGDAAPAAGAGVRRQVSMPGWLVVVGVPVLLVALAQAALAAVGGFLVFILHVVVLYLTVGLGAFHRQFSELRLLIGAGEEESARVALARWIGAGSAGNSRVDVATGAVGLGGQAFDLPGAAGASSQSLVRLATAQAILAAYRDVFAPLFWYAVLPGAIGPVLYLFARFAACYSYPVAGTAYYWIDWIPLRLAALGFALVGQFEDTVFCLRAVSGIKPEAQACGDPYLHQRLLLLPAAGGALGLRLTDAAVDAQLRTQAPDLDLPGAEPQAASLRPVAGLLLRSGVVWVGLYLLVILLR